VLRAREGRAPAEARAVDDIEVLIANLTREVDALERDRDKGVKIDEEHLGELKVKIAKAEGGARRVTEGALREGDRGREEGRRDAQEDGRREDRRGARRRPQGGRRRHRRARQGAGRGAAHPARRRRGRWSRVVAAWTGIPVGKMVQDDVRAMLEMEERSTSASRARTTRSTSSPRSSAPRARASSRRTRRRASSSSSAPPASARRRRRSPLADLLYGGERMMVTINMSEFQEKHTVSRLIGSPPGYVGYGEGGMLTEAVRQKPYTVVLLDECEKADLDVMNLFYQVFDKGMLSDGEGRVVDFKNTLIIMTSNLATDKIIPLCFVHRLPMVLSQCWCCGDQMTGLSCPACVGGACARCWREDCRPGAPRCRPAT
jgi:type VI secretion system protein VasG